MSRQLYERGMILDVLRFNRGLELQIAFMHLLAAIHRLNMPLSPHELRENLEYLVQKGYVRAARRRDLPGFRLGGMFGDERPDHIVTVQLTAMGMDLLEGTIQDAGVQV